ncbi:MAG: hypothetical protein KAT35_01150, partial [Candidatus Aenigmarchaeota archaeon]|nr:hypothetical protein [Candidatus Aenigmarchaeota archaeon]
IDALEMEKTELLGRSDELSERLRQTSEGYRESFSKLTVSVNSQVNQLKMEIAELSNGLKGLSGLEQRLEAQEKSHEKSLTRLEKELALVEKSLSDVERVKSELSQQKAFFQEAKLQMDKSLQAGIAYVRKEMEVNRREDARAALEECKQEIERITSLSEELNAYRRSHGARLDSAMEELSSIRSSLAELKILKERTGSLEGLGRELENRVGEIASRQKTASAMITSELSKRLDKSTAELKKGLDARRSEDAKAQLREFKEELKRLESVGQELSAFRSSQEKRVDELSQEMSSLSGPLADLRALGKRVSGLEEILIAADKRTDADRDRRTGQLNSLENRFNLIEKALGDLGSSQNALEKRVVSDNEQLQKVLSGVISDKGLLEKEFSIQKSKMIELIRELKNL